MRSEEEILRDIKSFKPVGGNWLPLDNLFFELWKHPISLKWVEPLLEVFERFPDEDGTGVLWSIIHGVEEINGYETILEKSYKNRPCEMKEIMLRRIENAKNAK